jgi:hypothetical protein
VFSRVASTVVSGAMTPVTGGEHVPTPPGGYVIRECVRSVMAALLPDGAGALVYFGEP